ncbi:glutamine synthetase, partial [Corynebacterium xerosis]
MGFTSPDQVIKYIEDEGVEFIDVRFTDVPGIEQHFTIPASAFDEDAAAEGLAFDGSSVRGFTTIDESDMALLPDLATATLDPFRKAKTLNIKF